MTVILSAEHIRKQYGKFVAVQDAGVEIRAGEILAMLGPNGAGKTTLIKILVGLLQKDAGQARILGMDLDHDLEKIRHRVGYVGQDTERSAYARLSVWENLMFFGALRGMSPETVRAQVRRLADCFDFHANLDKLFVTLSGGQKQTVVIMRALMHDPALVFLDEPTKGLDPIIARRIRGFLKAYAHEHGKALLLTSHVLSEVDELADRVALIQGGRIPVVGAPRELKAALGANDFIELQCVAGCERAFEQAAALPEVMCRMEREPGWVALGVKDPFIGAEAIFKTLRDAGVQTSFRHHTATLEDAFIHHIGVMSERFEL